MGLEGEGSDSGTVEVMVKSEVKESIVVYVVCELKDAMKLRLRESFTLSFYTLLVGAEDT